MLSPVAIKNGVCPHSCCSSALPSSQTTSRTDGSQNLYILEPPAAIGVTEVMVVEKYFCNKSLFSNVTQRERVEDAFSYS